VFAAAAEATSPSVPVGVNKGEIQIALQAVTLYLQPELLSQLERGSRVTQQEEFTQVLIVDDNNFNCMMMRELLIELSIESDSEPSPGKVIQIVAQKIA